jgi:hypothetical protein
MDDFFSDDPFVRRAAPQPAWRVRAYMAYELAMQKRRSVWAYWFPKKPSLIHELLFEIRGAELFYRYPGTSLEAEVLNTERGGTQPCATVLWTVIPGYWEERRGMLINGPHARMFFSRAA